MSTNRNMILAGALIAASGLGLLSATAPARADLGTDCHIVIRSTALGGNYTKCAPKGSMDCKNNRCTLTKLPPVSRTSLRPLRRHN
jgi:hypothetical protein